MTQRASLPVGLVLDPLFERHDTGPGHSERPARLAYVRQRLESEGVSSRCSRVDPVRATDVDLHRVHDAGYIVRVERACADGEQLIDSTDTAICAESAEIARYAAGAVGALCDQVVRGELRAGFAALRPPGHHAERDQSMGFCLFNNVAVAARRLQAEHGLERIFVLDWDVHHGNGTQHIFEEDPTILYASVHQSPLYPGTGSASEAGLGVGVGATLNCPLPPGAGNGPFLAAIRETIVPAARDFAPDFILISAGFDAHRADPLAALEVETSAFGEATRDLLDLARECCSGRLVSVLEGGYDLEALAASTACHLETMLEA